MRRHTGHKTASVNGENELKTETDTERGTERELKEKLLHQPIWNWFDLAMITIKRILGIPASSHAIDRDNNKKKNKITR